MISPRRSGWRNWTAGSNFRHSGFTLRVPRNDKELDAESCLGRLSALTQAIE
jgi:hypothetical protein